MDAYTIAIIAKNYWSCDFLKDQLIDIFGGLFNFTVHSPDTNPIKPIYNADMILIHEPSVLEDMYSYIKCECPALLLRRTISAKALENLRSLPNNSQALVVNLNDYMAKETMVNIYKLGIKNIKMSTWTPDNRGFPKVDYIITPRIYDFLPKCDTPKILIGSRILEVDIIMDILSYFNVNLSDAEIIIKNHMAKAPSFFHGVNYILENNRFLSVQVNAVFDKISKGIAIIDNQNIITYGNNSFLKILNLKSSDLLNRSLLELIDTYPQLEIATGKKEFSNELIEIYNKKIMINTNNLYNRSKYMGKLITLELYDRIRFIHQKGHETLVGHRNMAKYEFKDMIGTSKLFKKSITLGKKFANANSPVIIYGESGTGKELMASSIHNFSNRKNKPFVAVNCASIPSDLFESEFFGYEEGAFTSSKKGGSMGLFEKANGGTIFLDEISEIPYNLQSRLLRVLQENEIRKVGSNYNISIDVRVIAASNKDLNESVERNQFRQDLYYRLNVFQIIMPPLRKRPEDITLLCKYFMKTKYEKVISQEFFSFVNSYTWPGNIRELKNIVEFAYVTSDAVICINNLPDYVKNDRNFNKSVANSELKLRSMLVLKLIYNNIQNFISTSRASLTEGFSDLYYEISEMEMRTIIKDLVENHFILIPKGPQGCQITEKGMQYFHD